MSKLNEVDFVQKIYSVYKAIKALDNIQFGFLTIHGQGGKSMIDNIQSIVNDFFKTYPLFD